MFVISNQPRVTRSADLKSLARFLPELYSTQSYYHCKTLNNNDLNQVTDQQFSLKQWFPEGAHSCRLRKTGSAHCYLRISIALTNGHILRHHKRHV